MVIVKCLNCGKILLEKQGFDLNQKKEVPEKCPECGCDKTDVEIGC